jgi:transposase InsO family protein
MLHGLAAPSSTFEWSESADRAFQMVKRYVQDFRNHHRKPLRYDDEAPPINLITDACNTGIAGVISQGTDWQTAPVAAFFSAKLTSTQQNYPTHELKLFAGLESMRRHRYILQGTHFRWYTDHKGLEHLLKQKTLSPRQARWMEVLNEFSFDVIYVPGSDNVLADALSRIYSEDSPGTIRSPSEYAQYDENSPPPLINADPAAITVPIAAGLQSNAIRTRLRSGVISEQDWTHLRTGDRWDDPDFVDSLSRPAHPGVVRREGESTNEPSLTDPDDNLAHFAASTGTATGRGNGPELAQGGELALGSDARPLPGKEGASAGLGQHEQTESDLSSDSALRLPPQELSASMTALTASYGVGLTEDAGTLPQIALGDLAMDDLCELLRNNYASDSFFASIIKNPTHFRNFEFVDGVIYLHHHARRLLCIPASVMYKGQSLREILISEAHSLLAHLGPLKTVTYMQDHLWWKSMVRDVKAFCESCSTCARSKPSNQKPVGLLNPLDIPSHPWEAIGIDFIGPLPLSKDWESSYDYITVIIDLLTGMVQLVPSKTTYTAANIAELIFDAVYKYHGLPKRIVSDRDKLFTSRFWQRLNALLGVDLRMSSAYHPESDGATERANRTITQMVRQCISADQRDWVQKLPAIQFAINSARSDTTGYSPFFLNLGRIPRSLIWNSSQGNQYPGVIRFAERLRLALMSAHDAIIAARVKNTRDANRRVVNFEIGDLVYLSTENIKFKKGLVRKFIPKFIGPYPINADYQNGTFKVDLPPELKQRGIHPAFHSSLLRIHVPNDDRLFPGRRASQLGLAEQMEGEWSISHLRSHRNSGTKAIFEVEWTSGDITWLPYRDVQNWTALHDYLETLGFRTFLS